ncbi:uncharacterized protein LOC135145868 [Zophobas morio]|uniref:uncharacterized protein LOC135145868 n=1 Tax=Zophobas morio TaxID=2755281 RepID=UPI00308342AB
MQKALYSLLHSPQNNMKVTINNVSIKRNENFFSVLQEVFSRVFESDDPLALYCELLTQVLMKTQILQIIKEVQLGDELDVEAIYQLYVSIVEELGMTKACALFDDWNEASCQLVLADYKKSKDPLPSQLPFFRLEDKILKIRKFLVAATSKDVSVIITLIREEKNSNNKKDLVVDPKGDISYQYECSVIDTDPKLFINIPKYL